MDLEERYALIARNTEEIITSEDLREVLRSKSSPTGYIGFEPSGLVHIGWMVTAQKVRDFVDAGFSFIIFLADWHAYINDKLGGDIGNIRTCAEYMKDCFEALGLPRDKVEYRLASEIMDDIKYWEMVMKVGKASSLQRVKRAMTIMGRSEDEAEVDASKTLYPLMQAADLIFMDVDVAYAGLDQRRAHMLAREAAEKMGVKKAVAVHTPLLPGLKGGNRMDPVSAKMSKSDPDGSVLIHDAPEDIRRKLSKAYCPPEAEGNPVLAICRYIIFQRQDVMRIERPERFGGNLEVKGYDELERTYLAGKLHPMDLKNGTATALAEALAPAREYFQRKPENLERMRGVLAEVKKLR
ncbi:MAG TPA: tyrosine--tRNA ligase [Methanomassiliicoccales archaeon]|jgi:tyrosyl-tRNA synthetase|nr:tyrosine--tRNA ligase [Methanomassiliicoccales archaeon]HOE52803.1 tyrosine--tRNA ligase [Methanomassiliicoccales archaeon]HOO03826.1 tyrosine--tRNA ligase [Methanomassiliicoccales archaeon]HQM66263.1 tyrosine--tRNA ligase [Methanomassiliicoccales archaeon]HRR66950.1 tyrosine--tRNA ligase [Methanomassiliicoccales archaeon]